MRFGWSSGLVRIKRKLQAPRPAIAMYHRVARPDRDPWGLAVSPDHFRAQLRAMRRGRVVLPLDEFVRRGREGDLPARAAAITFDDGYRDNLVEAAPALAEADLPATLFLATGPMRRGRAYWWDALADMVLDAGPVQTAVRVAGREEVVSLGPRESADDDRAGWRAWDPPRTGREALYVRLWSLMLPLEPEQVDDAMAALGAALPHRPDPADGPMRAEEVAALIGSAPVTLGGHTVDHPALPSLRPDLSRAQVSRGKAEVEALAGRRAAGFAYPYGRHDARVARIVAEAGFGHACTTASGPARFTDPFTLSRATAQDRPGIDWLEG